MSDNDDKTNSSEIRSSESDLPKSLRYEFDKIVRSSDLQLWGRSYGVWGGNSVFRSPTSGGIPPTWGCSLVLVGGCRYQKTEFYKPIYIDHLLLLYVWNFATYKYLRDSFPYKTITSVLVLVGTNDFCWYQHPVHTS